MAFVAAALAFAIPARAQVRTPTHVACVGDSITAGYGASSSNKSYPADLAGIFGGGVQVGNFGHSGATLLSVGDLPYINQTEYTNATSFVSGAGASAVVDVIIMLGTNDSKSYNWAPQAGSTRAQQFMTDLGAMVDHFANLSAHPVVYLALPPAIFTNTFGISESVTHDQIDPIIMQVATQKGMPIIDVHTPTAPHPEDFSDGVHPTDPGYMFVAQIMHDGLLRPATGGGGAGGGGGGGAGGAAGRGGAGGAGGRGGAGGSGGGAAGRGGAAGGAAGRGGSGGAAAGAGGNGTGGATAGAGGASTGTAGTGGASGGSRGGSPAGGAGGSSAGAGGNGAGGGSTGNAGAAGAGTGGAAGAGTGGAAGAGTGGAGGAGTSGGDGGGCGCRLGAGAGSGVTAFWSLLVMLGLRRRARRAADARSRRRPAG